MGRDAHPSTRNGVHYGQRVLSAKGTGVQNPDGDARLRSDNINIARTAGILSHRTIKIKCYDRLSPGTPAARPDKAERLELPIQGAYVLIIEGTPLRIR